MGEDEALCVYRHKNYVTSTAAKNANDSKGITAERCFITPNAVATERKLF